MQVATPDALAAERLVMGAPTLHSTFPLRSALRAVLVSLSYKSYDTIEK